MPRARSEPGGVDLRRLPKIVFRKLGREMADGQARHPLYQEVETVEPTLEVDHTTMFSRDRLETIVHEALHLAVPAIPEKVVTYAARYIAKVLWHMKYRADEADQDERFSNKDR